MNARQQLIAAGLGTLMLVVTPLTHAARLWFDPIDLKPGMAAINAPLWFMLQGGEPPVSALQLDISYNPNDLTLGTFALDPGLTQHVLSYKNDAATGVLKIVVMPNSASATANPPIGAGTAGVGVKMISIPMTMKSTAAVGNKTLTLSNVVLGSAGGVPVPVTAENGAVYWWTDFDNDGSPDRLDPDDDNDGMTDWYETKYGLNPFYAGDAGQDPDGDGLTNVQEALYNTNPRLADTDGDGYNDYQEAIVMKRNPNIDDKLIPAVMQVINSLLLSD